MDATYGPNTAVERRPVKLRRPGSIGGGGQYWQPLDGNDRIGFELIVKPYKGVG
jgi:hypothetical protein